MLRLVSILILNTLILAGWGKCLYRLNAVRDDNNENRFFKFIIYGNISSMFLIFIIYPGLKILLQDRGGLSFNSGLFEEIFRFIIFIFLAIRIKSIKSQNDGILQAASVALGFALGQNYLYIMDSSLSLFFYRSFFGALGNMTFSLIWGLVWTATVALPGSRLKASSVFYALISVVFSMILHDVYTGFQGSGHPLTALFTVLLVLVLFISAYSYAKENAASKIYPLTRFRSSVLALQTVVRK